MGLKLLAEIGLDGSGFERGLHKIEHSAAHSIKALAVEAFGIYGVEQAIAKTVETATDLVNTSKRLDVTVEQLQLLRQAAKDGGTEMGALAGAFEKLDIARKKALSGGKEGDKARAAFKKIGITDADLQTQTAASLFMGKISGFAKNKSAEDVGPILRDVLGKGFGELMPVLKTDFDELGEKMHKLGSIMDTETAVKLKALGDNFELLKNIMAAQLGPVLLTLVEIIIGAIGKIKAAAAYLGGATSNMTAADWVKLIANPWLPQPNIDKQAGQDASDAVTKDWTDMIEAMRKKLKEEADALSHPKPINPDVDEPATKKGKHLAIQSDALVRVGNFLGSNGNTIERVNKQKIQLLTRIADSNDKLVMKMQSGGLGSFGLGVPLN